MIKTKRILLVALLSSMLSSCGLFSKFENEPEPEIVDDLYSYIEATSDTTNIGSIAWKDLFSDTYLQALIDKGLERNTDLNLARANVEQAEITLKTARLAYAPSLGLNLSGTINNTPTRSYTISSSASWEIDIFGKIKNNKEQQKMALEQSKAYSQAVQTQLISTLASSYYSLLLLDDQLDISRRSLVAWKANVHTIEVLRNAGRLNQTSVLQAKANQASLEASIVSIEEQIAALENSISALLLSPAHKIERGKLNDARFPEQLAVGVPLQLLSNRPDVRVAEYNLAQAYYATNVARASLYPSLTLGGSVSYSDGTGSVSNPKDIILSAVASIVQPLFYQNTLRAQVNISKSQQEQALLEFNQSILDAGVEVNTALIEWQSATDRLVFNQQQLDLLTEAVRSSELLMKHGNINYLEVLTAQQTLLSAELDYTSNKYDQIQGVINLYRSLGGGTF